MVLHGKDLPAGLHAEGGEPVRGDGKAGKIAVGRGALGEHLHDQGAHEVDRVPAVHAHIVVLGGRRHVTDLEKKRRAVRIGDVDGGDRLVQAVGGKVRHALGGHALGQQRRRVGEGRLAGGLRGHRRAQLAHGIDPVAPGDGHRGAALDLDALHLVRGGIRQVHGVVGVEFHVFADGLRQLRHADDQRGQHHDAAQRQQQQAALARVAVPHGLFQVLAGGQDDRVLHFFVHRSSTFQMNTENVPCTEYMIHFRRQMSSLIP